MTIDQLIDELMKIPRDQRRSLKAAVMVQCGSDESWWQDEREIKNIEVGYDYVTFT